MDAHHAVHDLRDAQVDDDAGQRERVAALQPELPPHQPQHRVDRVHRRRVQALAEAERDPGVRGERDRPGQLEVVAHGQRQLARAPAGTRSRSTRPPRRPAARGSPRPRRARRRPGSAGTASSRRTSSLQSRFPPQNLGGPVGWTPGSSGGIPSTPRNGDSRTSRPARSRPRPASASSSHARTADSPSATSSPSFRKDGQPPATVRPKAPTRTESIPTSSTCPARRPANRDRPDQRVTGVELRVARLETLALRAVGARRLEPPSRVERRESDRVAGVDLEHRLELAREVPVQVAPLERQLMERH